MRVFVLYVKVQHDAMAFQIQLRAIEKIEYM